tara:strand:- start:1053 stop:3866 length:2814 start_codon:yes stop_codon:yes gene_type:complete
MKKSVFFISLFFIGQFIFSQQNTTVDCNEGPVSTTFCYDTGLDNSYSFVSNDGTPLILTIDDGQVETNWDELEIRDSDGTVLYNGYGSGGDITGLTFQSSGDSITLEVVEDGSISCVSSGYIPITFTVACATCVNPQVDFEIVSDCLNAPQFFIDINITDMGDAGSLSIYDNQGNNLNAGATGTYQLGPYANNTDVQVEVQHNGDTNCSISSGSLTQEYCAITLVDCAIGPVSSSYCYDNGDTSQFEYISSDGSPLNLTINSGLIEAGWDIIIVSDTDGSILYQGDNGGDLTGLSFQSSGDSIFLGFQTDGSVSCTSSSTYAGGIDWTVACATCTNPSAEYTVVSDCINGPQFFVDVNITSMGSASSLTISDNLGSSNNLNNIGNLQFGPYPNATEVQIFVSNDQDVNCVIQSESLSQGVCALITNTSLYTVAELVTDVLIDSECNQASNITFSTGTNFGSTNGIGYFESNGSEWPFENGLIMTSGDVSNAAGPETGVLGDGDYNWPGDADLESYIPGLNLGDTNNASIIEFDFVPVSNSMSFDFIFAAEEYGTFQCTFTDAFAFLLTDSSGNTTNLAIVPGTNDPISVLTVRDNQFNGACESVNPEWFANYYGPGGLDPNTSPTNFIGHTEVMTAQAEVIPNELYNIKLVVADDGDTIYDSAVFIDGGSFDIGQLDLGEDILVSSGNALCEGQEIILDAGALPNNSSIEWFMDGTLIENETGVTMSVTETAFYSAIITVDNTDCAYGDEILVEFFQSPSIITSENSIIKCANEPYTLEVNVENSDQLNSLTYIWTLEGVDLQTSSENTYYLNEDDELYGEFTVTVFDDVTYCWDSITIDVDFFENSYCVDLPQGLSPNSDGFNDCLILDHLEAKEDIDRIEVFNRYGTKIYELNEYVDQWCGYDQEGKIVPVGTYFYIIYFNSSKEPITSWIYVNY